jgi:hypothetical protein
MEALSHADCLALWESGQVLHPLDQGLLAIQTAFPETRGEDIAGWPLGKRNRALAELRCALFGRWIRGWSTCEACGEKLEFAVDGEAIRDHSAPGAAVTIEAGARLLRLPNSRDLAQIASEDDAEIAANRLVELCTVSSQQADSAEKLTEQELELIGDRIAEADPLAEILLHFDCPVCAHSFDQPLDLSSFLWAEIAGRARKLLMDVVTLAAGFGWSEREILALSPLRREFYLRMVRA